MLNRTAVLLLSLVFLTAGLWKMSDPAVAAVRLTQAAVPASFSLAVALTLAVTETFTGALLLIPRFRRWGAGLACSLLAVFLGFIALHYQQLRGAECSCFPWLRRTVGPWFFVSDGIFLILALAVGWSGGRPRSAWRALLLLLALVSLTGGSYALHAMHHTGTLAPESIATEDGRAVSLRQGKVFLYFFDPQCLHCLEAGRVLSKFNWGATRVVGVPTTNPQFAGWFMGKAGLLARGPVSRDLATLRKAFPFDLPPAGVALENGYEKAILLRFDDKEPRGTLSALGFIE